MGRYSEGLPRSGWGMSTTSLLLWGIESTKDHEFCSFHSATAAGVMFFAGS